MASNYPHRYSILIVYNISYKWFLDVGIRGGQWSGGDWVIIGQLIFSHVTILGLAFTFSLW